MGRNVVGSMPRILHVAQSSAGGIASYFEEIAPFQAARYGSENVKFVIPDGSEHSPSIDPKQLIRFQSASRDARHLLDFVRTALRAIGDLKPDIVHLHSSFAGAILRPLLRMRRHRPRIVYCAHGWAFSMETSEAKQRTYAFLERQFAKTTDLIQVVSQSEYDAAARVGIPIAKMRVVPNGIAWVPRPQAEPRTGPIRLVFIGRHDRQMGLDILLDTIGQCPLTGIHFDIVGSSIAAGMTVNQPAFDNVTYYGWLPRQEAMQVLGKADAMIMPSRWEAFGLVAIESMRAAIPVIGSNRGAIPEIVNDGVGGYIFDLDDPDSLKTLLRRLTRDDLARLGTSARARWEQHYHSDRMNELTCQAYDDLMGGAPSCARDYEFVDSAPAALAQSVAAE
jgi:glycosyltransferase involved in cell wall biosynthesis